MRFSLVPHIRKPLFNHRDLQRFLALVPASALDGCFVRKASANTASGGRAMRIRGAEPAGAAAGAEGGEDALLQLQLSNGKMCAPASRPVPLRRFSASRRRPLCSAAAAP